MFVSHAHNAWAGDRKLSKRYGKLVQSPKEWLTEMLRFHRKEVTAWLLERIVKVEDENEESEDKKMLERGIGYGNGRMVRV